MADKDLQKPSQPSEYTSGFFGVDYRNFNATVVENWINPGNNFFRVRENLNADGSKPTRTDINRAKSVWNDTLSQCQRWVIRLHHEAAIKRKHEDQEVYVYYHTGIPVSKKDEIRECLDLGALYFLGNDFSTARQTVIDLTNVEFWRKIYPSDTVMDLVVHGWEEDAA